MKTQTYEFSANEWESLEECLICCAPVGRSAKTIRTIRSGFNFETCASCSTFFMNPRPTEAALLRFYEGHYWEQTNLSRSRRYRLEKQFRRALLYADHIKKTGSIQGGKILEIGAGFGGVVWALSKLLEMEPHAIELDSDARGFMNLLGVKTHTGTVSGSHAEKIGYDIVLLSHVLEHQLNPRELLTQAFSVLSPAGIIVIEVPHGNLVLDGGIEHPFVFSPYALDTLLTDFAAEFTYKAHNGLDNVLLPPRYLLAIGRSESSAYRASRPQRVSAKLTGITQRLATQIHAFGPLRGLNFRLGFFRRKATASRIEQIFELLPVEVSQWLDEYSVPNEELR